MREVLLHGSMDDTFDRSVAFARRLAESFGARLHVLYTVADPLSAGWTAEMAAERMPEVHHKMEAAAREKLSTWIPLDEQERLGIILAIAFGPTDEEIVRYAGEHRIDLAIVQAVAGSDLAANMAHALVDRAQCAVLVLR